MRPAKAFYEELYATHHIGRLERMLALGQRAAEGDREALATIDALTEGDVFERRLALLSLHRLRDGKRLLRFMEDVAGSLRTLAFTMAPRICDDVQALEALKIAYTMRRDRKLLRELAGRGRRAVVDRYLDWLAEQPGLHDFADLVPWASPEGVRRHLQRALARPSQVFWARLARGAPEAMAAVLCDRLAAVRGEPDAVTRQLIAAHTGTIVEGAPDAALGLLDVLCGRGIFAQNRHLPVLARVRPAATLALIEKYDLRPGGHPFSRSAEALEPAALARVVRRDPYLLGQAQALVERLSKEQIAAVVSAWCEVAEKAPVWGFPLLGKIADPAARERAWLGWSVAARDREGVIALDTIHKLPPDLREREARRHLHEVVALGTRPLGRIPYARFLPWEEAEATIKSFLGFPEGGVRGIALQAMLAIPGLRPDEPALVDRALAMVTARKNEQDPVRLVMLQALVAWPREIWRREHVPVIHQILRDALDAGDLSHWTATAAEQLLIRTFRLDPAAGAKWLGIFLKERGALYDVRLGAHLSDDEVRAAAPHLLAVAKRWKNQERVHQFIQFVESLGERIRLVEGLGEVVVEAMRALPWSFASEQLLLLLRRFDRERYAAILPAELRRWLDRGWYDEIIRHAGYREKPGKRQPPLHPEVAEALAQIAGGSKSVRDHQIVNALVLLRTRALSRFDALLPELLKKDPSYVCIPVIHWHLHERRQDLLDPFLGDRVIHGRFATGKSAWLLPFERGFHRWTPAQNRTFAETLAHVIADHERDTPTIWRCLAVLAAMDSAPLDALAAAAKDDRPAVQERAIRVMARCDQGQCVPTLIGCLEDERARIAIYGLKRALRDMLPRTALHLLGGVPLRKVTVAKEVIRLLGELRIEAAYNQLIKLAEGDLHRDVRIAVLRALWDHLDREPTWTIFDRAVAGPDWVMASRLGDIPADRLTRESDRRLSALLGRLLQRPEPEARIDLLQRAASLAISDPERTFLQACAERLVSIYDDEVQAAAMAIMHRSDEKDLERLPGLLGRALADPRCLHVAVNALLSVPIKSRASWIGAARAAEAVLASDPRWIELRIRCAAAAMEGPELARYLRRLGEAGLLGVDALAACRAAVEGLRIDQLAELTAVLHESTCPEVRRVALWALVRDAGTHRGWTKPRLARLAKLQHDPSPLVAGAALSVFPPREMAAEAKREHEKREREQEKPARS